MYLISPFQIWSRQWSWQRKWRCCLWLIPAFYLGDHRNAKAFYPQGIECFHRLWRARSASSWPYRGLSGLRERQSGVLWCQHHEMSLWARSGLHRNHVSSICVDGRRRNSFRGSHNCKTLGLFSWNVTTEKPIVVCLLCAWILLYISEGVLDCTSFCSFLDVILLSVLAETAGISL